MQSNKRALKINHEIRTVKLSRTLIYFSQCPPCGFNAKQNVSKTIKILLLKFLCLCQIFSNRKPSVVQDGKLAVSISSVNNNKSNYIQFIRDWHRMQIPVEARRGEPQVPVPDFINKLYSMIQTYPDIISFSEDGAQVHIHDHHKFITEMLQRYFRHRKWRSFIRQMNMYNFRKLNRGIKSFIFVNSIFKKGNQVNYCKIKRKVNTKQQQLEMQSNLELELKILLTIQSQKAGIQPNYLLPSIIPASIAHSSEQLAAFNSRNTISSVSASFPVQPQSRGYTNSLLFFTQSLLCYRKRVESLCVEIRQNIQYVSKERKSTQSKNINSSVKESMQMIDQISTRFREKIQQYVDNNRDSEHGDGEVDVMGYVNGQTMQNQNIKKIKPKQQPKVLSANFPQLMSFSSTSSLNPIIPQPIVNKPGSQTLLKQGTQKSVINSSNVKSTPSCSSIKNKALSDRDGSNKKQQGREINSEANVSKINGDNANNNKLGLSLFCSFNSVSNLISFERE